MNERLKELAKQAGAEFNDWHAVSLLDDEIEKFAELIAVECIEIVKTLSPGYQDYRNQIEDAFRRDCVAKIQEHFGVE